MAIDRDAVAILDAVDQRGVDFLAAIDELGIAGRHAHQRGFVRAQRIRQIGRQLVVNAEADRDKARSCPCPICSASRTVITLRDSSMPRRNVMGPRKLPFRNSSASTWADPAPVHRDRCVVDLADRREAVVERRGIDERLERRARLALRLHRAVELARGVAEAARQREHAARMRIHRHDGAVDFRHLPQAVMPGLPRRRLDIDDVAELDNLMRRRSARRPRLVLQFLARPCSRQRESAGGCRRRGRCGWLCRRKPSTTAMRQVSMPDWLIGGVWPAPFFQSPLTSRWFSAPRQP